MSAPPLPAPLTSPPRNDHKIEFYEFRDALRKNLKISKKELDDDKLSMCWHILDPDQSVDLSTDLANFMGSPNFLMSMSGSGGKTPEAVGQLSPVPVPTGK